MNVEVDRDEIPHLGEEGFLWDKPLAFLLVGWTGTPVPQVCSANEPLSSQTQEKVLSVWVMGEPFNLKLWGAPFSLVPTPLPSALLSMSSGSSQRSGLGGRWGLPPKAMNLNVYIWSPKNLEFLPLLPPGVSCCIQVPSTLIRCKAGEGSFQHGWHQTCSTKQGAELGFGCQHLQLGKQGRKSPLSAG